MENIKNIEKISKRFLIASFVCGIGATCSLIALIIGFYSEWKVPDFWAIFVTTFLVNFGGVVYFGTIENLKKEKRNQRLHDESMNKIEHEYNLKKLDQEIKLKELELQLMNKEKGKEVKNGNSN